MNRPSMAVLCVTVSLWLNSTAQITFQKTYGGISMEIASAVEQTSDGGYIITGFTESFSTGDSDVYLVRTDAIGNLLWTRTFGGPNNEYGYSVQQTIDGGFIVVGGSRGINFSYGWTYLIKTNSNGDSLWTRVFQINDYCSGLSVKQTSDGGYIIAGGAALINDGDVTLIKTDSNGNALWVKCIGGTSGDELGWNVQQTTDDGYIIVGRTTDFFGLGGDDLYLARTDSIGNLIWAKIFGGSLFDAGFSVVQTTDGGFFITGATSSFGATNSDIYIIKTDPNGDSLWTKIFSGPNILASLSGQQTSDGGYIIAGSKGNIGVNHDDLFLAKIDSIGNSIWTKTFDGMNYVIGNSVRQTSDGGFVIAGYRGPGFGNQDVYLIKTDANGSVGCNEMDTVATITSPPTQVIAPASIVTSPSNYSTSSQSMNVGNGGSVNTICMSDNIQSEIPNPFYLSPNPAINQFTTIHSPSPILGITVLNMISEKVCINLFAEGKEESRIDVINLKPGIYLVKVETERGLFTQKLIKQ